MRELRGVYNSTLTSTSCSEIRQQLCRKVESNNTLTARLYDQAPRWLSL